MTVLLSGGISKSKNYRNIFLMYENILIEKGYTVLNPARNTWPLKEHRLKMTKKQIWNYFMKKSISQLLQCDGIYLMPWWIFSKGARFEAFTAWRLDIPRIKIKIKKIKLIGCTVI